MDLLYLFGEAAAGGEQAAGWQVILFYVIFFGANILAFYTSAERALSFVTVVSMDCISAIM